MEQSYAFGDLGNTAKILRKINSGIWGEQSIICKDQESTDSPPHCVGLSYVLSLPINDPLIQNWLCLIIDYHRIVRYKICYVLSMTTNDLIVLADTETKGNNLRHSIDVLNT